MVASPLGQRLQEVLGARVDPLHVLDDHDHRSPLALAENHGSENLVRSIAQPGSLHPQQELLRHREAQEMVQ